MTIQDAKQYLKNHKEELLTGGVSGAKVYDICGEYVLKCVSRADLEDAGQYDAYRKEASWYECTDSRKGEFRLNYLPELLDTYSTDEETAVLMKRYRTIPQKFDTELLKKIMEALAAVHTTHVPAFLNVKGAEEKQKDIESSLFYTAVCAASAKQPGLTAPESGRSMTSSLQEGKEQGQDGQCERANFLSEEQISASLSGWYSVLNEHPGIFSETPLKQLAEKINCIILWHEQEESVLNHGDFHRGNLLLDECGNILICDWQGVCVGAASGDLSFFFSRLSADGIYLDERQAVEFYVQEIKRLSGKILVPEEICRHMDAADIITSFVFWHEYLHGNDVDRVRGIYGKMVDKFQRFVDCEGKNCLN